MKTMMKTLVQLILIAMLVSIPAHGKEKAKASPPATAVSTTAPFDHLTTGFELDGQHRLVKCESCHVDGIFKGTPTSCVGCHAPGTRVQASTKTVKHVISTNNCADCHSPTGWSPADRFDHTQVSGTCSSCHNSVQAVGKPVNHISTSLDCSLCHNTMSWVASAFDHAGITGGCSDCHNGVKATGKTKDHIISSNTCETCHTSTTTWLPAKFDHTGIVGNCIGCHDGAHTNVSSKNAGHILTTNLCENCHNTSVWKPATTVDHTQVVGICVTCHNGIIAKGKKDDPNPSGHPVSSDACDMCHSTTGNFKDGVFDHTGVAPGTCTTCHNGVKASGRPLPSVDKAHPQNSQECDACHNTLSWYDVSVVDHTNITTGCSNCHNGTVSGADAKGPKHMTTTRECNVCHLATATTWTPLIFKHTSPEYPGDHNASLNLTCSSCHTTNTDAATWKYATYRPNCAGCHANRFSSGDHPNKIQGTTSTRYQVSELQNCTGACHTYTDSSLTTIAKGGQRTGQHKVTDTRFHGN